jgi:hypothetical protein
MTLTCIHYIHNFLHPIHGNKFSIYESTLVYVRQDKIHNTITPKVDSSRFSFNFHSGIIFIAAYNRNTCRHQIAHTHTHTGKRKIMFSMKEKLKMNVQYI